MISMTTGDLRAKACPSAHWPVFCTSLLALVVLFGSTVAQAETGAQEARSWKTVAELSPEERVQLDLSASTPRHTEFSYLPAEPFPFTPPYTAEEMGLRAMEFGYWRRWTSSTVQVYGSVDAHGYMPTWGKCVTSVSYHVADGIAGHLYAKPGQNDYSALLQYLAPPENYGNQSLYIRYRTDQSFTKKQDTFRYSSALRRVRRYPTPQRQVKYPAYPFTYDDDIGRDAWEFTWRVLGTDILSRTVRFPVTRPTITLATPTGSFQDVSTSSIKIMGDDYPWYTADGGVRTYVVEATAKEDWLPNYYAPRILYWLDQRTFAPLRMEEYDRDGKLIFISVRLGALINPALGERGYSSIAHIDWDLTADLLSYLFTDANVTQSWSEQDQGLFFSPGFLPREWRLTSLKSQAEVPTPREFFLRPALEEDKFPVERKIAISDELRARVDAQERAGRLVFSGEDAGDGLTTTVKNEGTQEPTESHLPGPTEATIHTAPLRTSQDTTGEVLTSAQNN